MYTHLLFLHSLVRWLVAAALLLTLARSLRGWLTHAPFSKPDDTLRHITATLAHCQLAIGYILYFKSPVVAYFLQQHPPEFEYTFFGILHIALMTLAVIVITIGSSVAKRQETAGTRFKTITLCFGVALLIIFIAIPWPFSPLANRPWIRSF